MESAASTFTSTVRVGMNVAPVGEPSSWIGSEGRSVGANLLIAIITFRRRRLEPQVLEHLDPVVPHIFPPVYF